MTQVDQTFTIEGPDPEAVTLAALAGLPYTPTQAMLDTARAALAGVRAEGAVVASLAALGYATGAVTVFEHSTIEGWFERTVDSQTAVLLHLRERAARNAAQSMRGLVGPETAYIALRPEIVGDPDATEATFAIGDQIPGPPEQAIEITYSCPTRPLLIQQAL